MSGGVALRLDRIAGLALAMALIVAAPSPAPSHETRPSPAPGRPSIFGPGVTLARSSPQPAASSSAAVGPQGIQGPADPDVSFDLLERLRALVAEPTDVEAAARRLDSEPGRIFDFVRDEISFHAYRGVLRGALGTLAGRAGNSLDRTLLAAELLKRSGRAVRFVEGRLGDDAAARVLRRVAPEQGPPSAPASPRENPLRALGVSDGEYQALRARDDADREAFFQDVLAEVETLSASIRAALDRDHVRLGAAAAPAARPGIPLAAAGALVAIALLLYLVRRASPARPARRRAMGLAAAAAGLAALAVVVVAATRTATGDELAEVVRDHFWLQYQDGGRWIDFDTSATDASIGQRLAEPRRQYEELPPDLYHRVAFEVEIEQLRTGALTRRRLLGVSFNVADLFGARLDFVNAPNAPEGSVTPDSLATVTQYLPTIVVNGEPFYGEGFDLRGEAVPASRFGPVGRAAGAIEKVFEQIGKALEEPSSEEGLHLTAEWLHIRLTSPSGGARTFTREILDRIGIEHRGGRGAPQIGPEYRDARRIRYLLALTYNILLPNTEFSRSFVAGTLLRQLARKRALFRAAVEKPGDEQSLARELADAGQTDLPLPLVALWHLSTEAARRLAAAVPGHMVYPREAGVLLYKTRLDVAPDGHTVVEEGFDVVHHALTAVARPGAGFDPTLNVRLGVALTALERRLGRRLHDALLDTVSSGALQMAERAELVRSVSAIDVFLVARTSDAALVLLRGHDRRQIDALGVSAAARARLAQEAGGGAIIVVPEREIAFPGFAAVGWWRVDGRTGATLGVLETGEGGLVSYLRTLWIQFNVVAFNVIIFVQRYHGYVAMLGLGAAIVAALLGLTAVAEAILVVLQVALQVGGPAPGARRTGAGPPAPRSPPGVRPGGRPGVPPSQAAKPGAPGNPFAERSMRPRQNAYRGFPGEAQYEGKVVATRISVADSVKGGRVVVNGQPAEGDFLYVIDSRGRMYIYPRAQGVHHSSLVPPGEDVHGAGLVTFRNGRPTVIDGESGHYFAEDPILPTRGEEEQWIAAMKALFEFMGLPAPGQIFSGRR